MGFIFFCMPKISTRIWIQIGIWVRVLICRVWSLYASDKSCYFTRFSAVCLTLSLHIFKTKQLMYGVLLQYFSTFLLNPVCDPLNHGGHCVCDTYFNIQKMNFAYLLYVFMSYISYNSEHKHCYFSIWLWPVGLCNRNILCWLWGRNRSFTHYLQFLRPFFVRSAFVFENVIGPESNETLIFGLKKEFEQFIELVVTEIYSAAYSLVLALLFLFILWRTYHCLPLLACVYVCRM